MFKSDIDSGVPIPIGYLPVYMLTSVELHVSLAEPCL